MKNTNLLLLGILVVVVGYLVYRKKGISSKQTPSILNNNVTDNNTSTEEKVADSKTEEPKITVWQGVADSVRKDFEKQILDLNIKNQSCMTIDPTTRERESCGIAVATMAHSIRTKLKPMNLTINQRSGYWTVEKL